MEIEEILEADGLASAVRALPEFGRLHGETVEEMGDRLAVFPASRFSDGTPEDEWPALWQLRPEKPARRLVKYWPKFKEEMRLLICTDDKKYAAVRRQLLTGGKKSQAVILSTISAALAPHIGVIAGVAVPLSGITLYAIAVAGKHALCRGESLDVPLEKS